MNTPTKNQFLFLSLISIALLLSACQPGAKEDSAASQPAENKPAVSTLSVTMTPSSTVTMAPSLTNTITPLPTNTTTSEPTSTFTPTEFVGFNGAYVYRSFANYDGTTIYFIVPGIQSSYYGVVDGEDIDCEPDPSQVNLLVCSSKVNLFGTDIKDFKFFADPERTFLVHEDSYTTYLDQIPATPTLANIFWPHAEFTDADITWGYTPSDCAVRGINLTCETEYRQYDDNSCRVGMSCYDSCGFYYSVDTIKGRSGEYKFSGPCW